MKAITEVDGDTATVRAFTTHGHERLADLLTKAAGPERVREVRGVSTGGRGFRVPLDIAQAAGLVPRGDVTFPDPEDTADQSEDTTQPDQETTSDTTPEPAGDPEQDASTATDSDDTSDPTTDDTPAAKPARKAASRSRTKAADAPAGD